MCNPPALRLAVRKNAIFTDGGHLYAQLIRIEALFTDGNVNQPVYIDLRFIPENYTDLSGELQGCS